MTNYTDEHGRICSNEPPVKVYVPLEARDPTWHAPNSLFIKSEDRVKKNLEDIELSVLVVEKVIREKVYADNYISSRCKKNSHGNSKSVFRCRGVRSNC